MQYRECPFCGAALDHGEVCECRRKDFRVVILRETGSIEVCLLPNGADGLRSILGREMNVASVTDDVKIIFNYEGEKQGLAKNRYFGGYFGPVVFVGEDAYRNLRGLKSAEITDIIQCF